VEGDEGCWVSAADERLGLPGARRRELAEACARAWVNGAAGDYAHGPWNVLAALDADDGFGTRFAARGVLRRGDGRFLLFRYPFSDGSWRFVIPGGGAEPGETPQEALVREVQEETGAEPIELRPGGLVLYHLIASSVDRHPTIQYSPVFLGDIADELPDTGGREAHWFSVEEFRAQPRAPISEPVLELLDEAARAVRPRPSAVWLPA